MLEKQNLPLLPMDLFATYFLMGIHIFSVSWLGSSHLPYVIIIISALAIILAIIYTYRLGRTIGAQFFIQWWRLVDLVSCLAFIIYGLAYHLST